MDAQYAFVDIKSPDGQEFSIELVKDRTTIGRSEGSNDLALQPDPQRLVTRRTHCTIERDPEGWWVVDNHSVNGTFVQKGQDMEVVNGRAPIMDGDTICILGRLTEAEDPIYWTLTFRDPLKTQHVGGMLRPMYLEYDWIQAKLFVVDGSHRQEVQGLRPQEHKLIRYMARRNQANNNVPVMCTYEELITAMWDEESYGHTRNDIIHLVWELRQKIEPDPKDPQFLQTERGLGYRLITRPLME